MFQNINMFEIRFTLEIIVKMEINKINSGVQSILN